MVRCRSAIAKAVIHTTTPNTRGVVSWRPQISMKSITDGTSKTALCGEVGRGTFRRRSGFQWRRIPGVSTRRNEAVLPALWSRPPFRSATVVSGNDALAYGDEGFGGMHNGIVMFGMCDGSVQPISRDIDGAVLDCMATRAGDDPYQLDKPAKSCH